MEPGLKCVMCRLSVSANGSAGEGLQNWHQVLRSLERAYDVIHSTSPHKVASCGFEANTAYSAFDAPIVVPAPCPGSTSVSSGSTYNSRVIDAISSCNASGVRE